MKVPFILTPTAIPSAVWLTCPARIWSGAPASGIRKSFPALTAQRHRSLPCSAIPCCPGHRAAERQIAVFRRECERNQDRVISCVNASQAEQAFADGKLAAFLSVEGAELLDCAVEKLDWAYARGVRFINLTWNHANALSGSHCDEPERGLSGQGKGLCPAYGTAWNAARCVPSVRCRLLGFG